MTSVFQDSETGTLVVPFTEMKELKVVRCFPFTPVWEVGDRRRS